MLLGSRLLRLSAAVAGGFRRSLTTAASHPPWAMMRLSSEVAGAPSVDVRLAEPPRISEIRVPEHLLKTSGSPNPAGGALKSFASGVTTASGGLLFLTYLDRCLIAPIWGNTDPTGLDLPSVTRFVCNPVTRELYRLPDSICNPLDDFLCGPHMGFITQADRGHGPPDRFAAAKLGGDVMIRFLSETEQWEFVKVSPFTRLARQMGVYQEPLAFRGRLWWVDATCGAFSVDPFSDLPELSFIQLPRHSVLPERAPEEDPIRYRRVGISEGRLRYVEVSQEEPFLLSSFVLDYEGDDWTLEHRVVLNKIWGRSTWLPLQTSGDAHILLIDPLNANVVYLMVMSQIVVVDMEREEVIESCLYSGYNCFNPSIPCVLPPWLGSSRIPSAGKKYVEENKTLADTLVCSDIH